MALSLLWLLGSSLVTFALARYILFHLETSAHFTENLPWAGLREESYRTLRASFRQLLQSSRTLIDGYTRYGKMGIPFVIPDPSFQRQIMLPQEHIKWLSQQSEDTLSLWKVRNKKNGIPYMAITVDHKSSIAFTEKVIGRCLTRNLDRIQVDVYAEVRASVDELLGMDTDSWHEVQGHETMTNIAKRTGTRAMFGLSLCRDQDYLHNLGRLNMLMGIATMVIGQLPPIIRNVVGNLIRIPIRYYKTKVMRTLVPFIEKKMQDFEQKNLDRTVGDQSNDFLTQAVTFAMTTKDRTVCSNAPHLAEQLVNLSFAALAAMGMVGLHVFFDLLSTPSELNLLSTIREEAAQIFTSEAAWTDPGALQRMKITASAMRESLRHSPVQVRSMLREVMPREGLHLPNGTQVAQGTWIGVPAQAIHMDERFYTNPSKYDPFRFVREQERAGKEKADATQPSDTFLGFSYGRHACPGRWFAEQFLKLLIAYIVLHYDIEPLAKRPDNTVFGDALVPSLTTGLRVRRRCV